MQFAYLDIETSWQRTITVIGIYRPGLGTKQLVAPNIRTSTLLEAMEGVSCVFTYNGARFDLPVIHRYLGVNLVARHEHRDLMYDCWNQKLKGGLKAVERRLGIHRDTEGVDGWAAVRLWSAYQRGDYEALNMLLHYNREDCENLEIVAQKLGILDEMEATARNAKSAAQTVLQSAIETLTHLAPPEPSVQPVSAVAILPLTDSPA